MASGSCSGFCLLRDSVSVSLQDSAIDSVDAIFIGVAAGGKGDRIEGDAVFGAILCSQVIDLIFLQSCIAERNIRAFAHTDESSCCAGVCLTHGKRYAGDHQRAADCDSREFFLII